MYGAEIVNRNVAVRLLFTADISVVTATEHADWARCNHISSTALYYIQLANVRETIQLISAVTIIIVTIFIATV